MQLTVLLGDRHRLNDAERTAAGKERRLAVARIPHGLRDVLGRRLGFERALAHSQDEGR